MTTTRFAFRFVSTHQDLLDALAASASARTGTSLGFRISVLAMGVAWLAGVVLVLFTAARPAAWWHAVVWGLLGGAIALSFTLRSWQMRRRTLNTTPGTQPITLEFGDAGVEIAAEGVGRFRCDWRHVARLIDLPGGVLLTFDDGRVQWLPARVFATPTDRRTFVEYATGKIPVAPHP